MGDSHSKYDPVKRSAARIFHSNYKKDSTLSLDEFIEISQKNCYYCNSEPKNSFCDKKNGAAFIYNGLDRLDYSIGHTQDNCVPCCKWCNISKNTRSVSEFLEWVKLVYTNKIS